MKAVLILTGVIAPFAMQADQAMPNSNQMMSNSANTQQASYLPGEMVRDGQMPAGYNQTASFVANGGWDVFFVGDFLYWHLNQDTQDMGTIIDTTSSGVAAIVNGDGQSIRFNPSYKPGFQVGMGFNMKGMDNWAVFGEYTWYQNKTSKSVTADSDQVIVAATGLLLDRTVTAGSISGSSRYHYNNGLIAFNRAFYWGKKLTGNFGCGLRGLWVSQHASTTASDLSYVGYTKATLIPESGNLSTKIEQESWALGPRCKLDTNWLLGYGFRLMGEVAGSVLYTRYTENEFSFIESSYANYSKSTNPVNTLRAITEMSMGLGWGSYFGDNNDFHFDLGAGYDFDVYWNQNLSMTGSPGNTYIHGLNVSVRLDF